MVGLIMFWIYFIGGFIASFLLLNSSYLEFNRIDNGDIFAAIFIFFTSWFGVIAMLFYYFIAGVSRISYSKNFAKKITNMFEKLYDKNDNITNKENDLFDVNKINKNDNITNKKIHLFDVNNNKRIDIFDEMDDNYEIYYDDK